MKAANAVQHNTGYVVYSDAIVQDLPIARTMEVLMLP